MISIKVGAISLGHSQESEKNHSLTMQVRVGDDLTNTLFTFRLFPHRNVHQSNIRGLSWHLEQHVQRLGCLGERRDKCQGNKLNN